LRAVGGDATTTGPTDDPTFFFVGAAASEPLGGTAFRSAPYLGVNWQIMPRWLAGIEGDFGIANQATSLEGFGFSPGVFAFERNKSDTFAVRTTWDASARGRVGFLVTPALLAYGTAGAAWQHFTVASTCVSLACGELAPAFVTESTTKAGWTVGAGLESMLSGNWFARAEYRFADFRPTSLTLPRQDRVGNPVSSNFDVGLRTHTATFGISYKFGGAVPPI
jgi:outer membrane immunogenic protein